MAATSFSTKPFNTLISQKFDTIWPQHQKPLNTLPIEKKIRIMADIITSKVQTCDPKKYHIIIQVVSEKIFCEEAADFLKDNLYLTTEPLQTQVQLITKYICSKIAAGHRGEMPDEQIVKTIRDTITLHLLIQIASPKITASQENSNWRKEAKDFKKTYQRQLEQTSSKSIDKAFEYASQTIYNREVNDWHLQFIDMHLSDAIIENDFSLAINLKQASNDPEILSQQNPVEIWGILKNRYPELTKPKLFNKRNEDEVFKQFVEKNPTPETLIQTLLDCMSPEKRLNTEAAISAFNFRNQRALEFMKEIALTPPENLHLTEFYQHLHSVIGLPIDTIEKILLSAQNKIPFGPNISPEVKRKQAMLHLAANYSRLPAQLKLLNNIFGSFNEKQQNQANEYSKKFNPKDFTNPLNEKTQSFLAIGIALYQGLYIEDTSGGVADKFRELFPFEDCWHSHIITPTQREILQNGKKWLAQSSEACAMIYDTMLEQENTRCTFNMHKSVLDGAKTGNTQNYFMTDENGEKIFLTEQLFLDFDRTYEELILVPETDKAIAFPGEYKMFEAGLAVVKSLNQIAEGDDRLKFLLQELTAQSPQIALNMQWTTEELLEKTEIKTLPGFFLRTPHTISTAIRKVNPNLVTVEYDYQLRVMDPQGNHSKSYPLRYTLEIHRDKAGNWIVQQPTRSLLSLEGPESLLSKKYKPKPIPRDERLVYLRQPDLHKSNVELNAKGKEVEDQTPSLATPSFTELDDHIHNS